MTNNLSKNANSVQTTLDSFKLNCKVIELPTSTRTAAEAAQSIGCEIAQIAKSLIFQTKQTLKPILVIASGANQVNIAQIESLCNEQLIKATAEFVKNSTGFSIGGIPPVGHKNKIETIFIDKTLLKFENCYAAAGMPNAVFCIKSNDLLKITAGTLIEFKK